jgi:predicted GIY-YIG superfamily endonuclease
MVYLVHLERPLAHARHYIGFVETPDRLDTRIEYHRQGRGSKFLRAVAEAGIDFAVARTWRDGDRRLERRLKNRKEAPRLCPLCRGGQS